MALEPFAIVFDQPATGSKAIPKPGAGFTHRRQATFIEFISHSMRSSCALTVSMREKSMRLPTPSRFVVSGGSLASAERLFGTRHPDLDPGCRHCVGGEIHIVTVL
jgi:hypothetical protein